MIYNVRALFRCQILSSDLRDSPQNVTVYNSRRRIVCCNGRWRGTIVRHSELYIIIQFQIFKITKAHYYFVIVTFFFMSTLGENRPNTIDYIQIQFHSLLQVQICLFVNNLIETKISAQKYTALRTHN